MGKQQGPIDEETTASAGRDAAAPGTQPPSTDTPDTEDRKPATTQEAETDELMDDRFQATDN
jgi:hypothetical protein